MKQINELRKAYRAAYREYAARYDTLQNLRQPSENDTADVRAIESAEIDLEKARRAYNAARDLLAEQMHDEQVIAVASGR